MTQSIQRETIVEMLLNSVEAERYVRGALLNNLVDELSGSETFLPATEMARSLLGALEEGGVGEREFCVRIAELRACVQVLARRGPSGGSAWSATAA